MAIDFPASPTNGQTFTSGSVTYTWDGTKWTAVAAAGSSNSISQGNTNATVTDTGSDGRFVVTTEGSERLRVDSSGRLGIGTTPSALLHIKQNDAVGPTLQLENNAQSVYINNWGSTGAGGNRVNRFEVNAAATGYAAAICAASQVEFHVGGTNNEKARLDSSGRLLIGTSSNRATNITGTTNNVVIESAGSWASLVLATNQNAGSAAYQTFLRSRGTTAGSTTIVQNGDGLGYLSFEGTDGSNPIPAAWISAHVDGTPGANDMPGRLVFSTTADGASSPTERMRIHNNGRVSIGTTAANYTLDVRNNGATESGLGVSQSNASFAQSSVFIDVNRTTTDGTYNFLRCIQQSAYDKLFIRDSGNVVNANNSYGAISDARLKENIVDATSQWDDVKALQVRKYNFKEETGQPTHTQIGLIAQEAETVSPGLVSETIDRDAEGNDLGTTTKSVNYSVLYMKAVKALQEAMERIETLEAKVAALESA